MVEIYYLRKKTKERIKIVDTFKGSLSSLGQFLATESPLKWTKNAFDFILKASFALNILLREILGIMYFVIVC